MGIGEKQIRASIENEQLDVIRIGNRAYIAMEFFEKPYVNRFSPELSYSFANDETNDYINLRIVMEKEDEVCSITEFYPYAFLYENEMKELFGVNVRMINMDYNSKLYRLKDETPFINK